MLPSGIGVRVVPTILYCIRQGGEGRSLASEIAACPENGGSVAAGQSEGWMDLYLQTYVVADDAALHPAGNRRAAVRFVPFVRVLSVERFLTACGPIGRLSVPVGIL